MNNPEFYNKNNGWQFKDAQKCLEKYGNKMNWKNGANIIDIGSGDGRVTTQVLQNFLPEDFVMLKGVDVSEDMVRFANENYGNERISFSQLDVTGELSELYRDTFHHAFSFYCMHWICDQEKAFQNIYDLLKEDGNCLLMLICNCQVFELFIAMARSEKWKHLTGRPANAIVARYQELKEPEKEVRKIMEDIGFKNIFVEVTDLPYVYDSLESLKIFMQALNPLKLPLDLVEDFGNDAIEVMIQLKLLKMVNGGPKVRLENAQMVVYGSKS